MLKLFDQYVHGLLGRRGFLQSAARYTAGVAGAELALQQLSPNFAMAQQVQPNDPRLKAAYVEHPSPQGYGKLRGYLVQPAAAAGQLPTVLVVHENRGLNPHIEDITRRLALDNFIAFAPDACSRSAASPAPRRPRASRRRCCCSTRATTSASTPAGPSTKRR